MKILITIPTYKRIKKLERCLYSILMNSYQDFKILVIADNKDIETKKFIQYLNHPKIQCIMNDKHLYVIGSWNRFFRENYNKAWDIFSNLVDDVELFPDCIQNAINCMKLNFPDLDGIVGLSQRCPGDPKPHGTPYGQILIGKKFVERYKAVNYQVCCPDYTHFKQDYELWLFATSLNKFVHCKEALLKHYHPCFIKEEVDETHFIVRGDIIKEDRKIYNLRKERGLIWGKTWETVNEKNK